MARPTERGSPNRCDSLYRFHVFRTAALRGRPDVDSRSIWPRGLALGAFGDCGHVRPAVSRTVKHPFGFCGARNLDRHWFCRLAVDDCAGVCDRPCARRLVVLRCHWGKPASPCGGEIDSGCVARKPVWFSRHFLHYLSRP